MMKFVSEQLGHDQLTVESLGTLMVPRSSWPVPEKCCVPPGELLLDPPPVTGEAEVEWAVAAEWVTVTVRVTVTVFGGAGAAATVTVFPGVVTVSVVVVVDPHAATRLEATTAPTVTMAFLRQTCWRGRDASPLSDSGMYAPSQSLCGSYATEIASDGEGLERVRRLVRQTMRPCLVL
jgi:hypothetical protein